MRVTMLLCAALLLSAAAHADSLFNQQAEQGGSLISDDIHRFEAGDLITVLVQEQVTASTSAETSTQKESDVSAESNPGDNTFLVDNNGLNILNAEELPNWQVEAENETTNEGETNRTSTLQTTITCTVKEVLPNGNLAIEGEKMIAVNREDTTLYLTGVVRPRDISPNNTVASPQVANVHLKLKGKGPLWNTQRRGLVTRFLDWFSPF